jgi:hypothetical protein
MKRLLLLCALPTLLASCISSPSQQYNHWSASSIAPSMARNFLGYDPDTDFTYKNRLWMDRKNIDLTLQRHFLNWNPLSPVQKEDPSLYPPRPANTPLPNPIPYVVMLPGSLFGTFEEGGGAEFWSGFSTTLSPFRAMTVSFVNETIGANGPVMSIFTGGDYVYPEDREPEMADME